MERHPGGLVEPAVVEALQCGQDLAREAAPPLFLRCEGRSQRGRERIESYSPAVDEGIYVRLNPLPPGLHTLKLHAENPGAGFVWDVPYHLAVVPVVTK